MHIEKYGEVGKTAFDCAREGDVVALRWSTNIATIWQTVSAVITLFRPEIVGGLSAASDTLLDPIHRRLASSFCK